MEAEVRYSGMPQNMVKSLGNHIPVSYTHLDVYKRQLVSHALHVAKYQERPVQVDLCDSKDDGGAVHRCLHSIMHFIEDHAKEAGIPVRFAASKLAAVSYTHLDVYKRQPVHKGCARCGCDQVRVLFKRRQSVPDDKRVRGGDLKGEQGDGGQSPARPGMCAARMEGKARQRRAG